MHKAQKTGCPNAGTFLVVGAQGRRKGKQLRQKPGALHLWGTHRAEEDADRHEVHAVSRSQTMGILWVEWPAVH